MLNTLNELLELLEREAIPEHKHPNVELKQDWAKSYGNKLSALGNRTSKERRWLLIGVDDKGRIAGKSESWARQTEQVLSQHINQCLDPLQSCAGISAHGLRGGWIIAVEMQNPGDVVYWENDACSGAGTTIKTMSPEEILQLRVQLPGLSDFSSQTATGAYDRSLLDHFSDRVRTRGHQTEFGSSSGDSDGTDVLKRLGILDRQVARILFGDASCRVVKYNRDGDPEENKKLLGLYRLLRPEFAEEVQQWTCEALHTNRFPYPGRALKEALANAVAHAAYFESNGDVIVELHPDHITISNLSVRESGYFANRWFSRSHKTINPLLMEVLRVAGLVDELGRGKNLIFSESIRGGKRAPEVILERAGKYDRWKLTLYGGEEDDKLLRLLDRSRSAYADEQKALIAQALVLWRGKPVAEIRNYIDGDFSRQFAEVLASLEGPIFYSREQDRITLRRWAQVLLGEGKDSKALSPAEEKDLQRLAYDVQVKFHEGIITPKDLRRLAAMGDTKSEQVLSSNILANWAEQGLVKRSGHGKYQFIRRSAAKQGVDLAELVALFAKQSYSTSEQ